jgi:hypothetical protein
MTTHILLISKQAVPNLVPLLDPQIKPQKAILIVSKDMQQRAKWLKSVLQKQAIQCVIKEIDNAYDIKHMQDTVINLILNNHENEQLILNATGGTKPMSIAAYEEFRVEGLPIYYVHPESDELIWLHDKETQNHQIADKVKLDNFLLAHGAQVTALEQHKPREKDLELAKKIINQVSYFAKAISQLNYLAQSAEKTLLSLPIENVINLQTAPFYDLIDMFERDGYLTEREGKLKFKSKKNQFHVNGGWLEGWVYNQVRELKKNNVNIQESASNLKIERDLGRGKPVPNEIDTAFLYNNRLHLIECKTRRLAGNESTTADTLYKMDSLKPIMGGLQARGMLVSLLNVDDKARSRAAELNIKICAGEQVKNLSTHIMEMIKK